MRPAEFREIAHSGGKLTLSTFQEDSGSLSYQIRFDFNRPVPSRVWAVWAIPQGVAVDALDMRGVGVPRNPPPIPGCYPVLIGSDSEGMFGHQCFACSGYWRSEDVASCPYCAADGKRHDFLTDAQKVYVAEYCHVFSAALSRGVSGDYVIDLDAVADAVGSETEKPPFYYAEEGQQKQFKCSACGAFHDIIGRFSYCCVCRTRNDLSEFESRTLPALRADIQSRGDYGRRVAEAVGAFDTYVGQYLREITRRVPMRSRRKNRIEKMRFHSLEVVAIEILATCDIDVFAGLSEEDVVLAKRMFHRRHIYEHNGGVVDSKYIKDSGDQSVRLNQEIRETQADAHRLVGLVAKMVANVHEGFHDIFALRKEPTRRHTKNDEFS